MKISQHVTVGGHNTKHNLDLKYRSSLPHVNPSLSHANIILEQHPISEIYQDLFSVAVEKYNKKQKRSDRKIDGAKGYYKSVVADQRGARGANNKNGKRAIYEQVVGLGNRDSMSPRDAAARELATEVFKDFHQRFKQEYPNLQIVESVIHMDEEAGIHLHLAYVPWGDGYKRGMEKQQSLSKACENMGFSHLELTQRLKDLLEEVSLQHGIERLDVHNHEHHRPTAEFKAAMRELAVAENKTIEASQKLAEVNKEVEVAKASLTSLQGSYDALVEEWNELVVEYTDLKEEVQVLQEKKSKLELILAKLEQKIESYKDFIRGWLQEPFVKLREFLKSHTVSQAQEQAQWLNQAHQSGIAELLWQYETAKADDIDQEHRGEGYTSRGAADIER